jgi:hypothetical protein
MSEIFRSIIFPKKTNESKIPHPLQPHCGTYGYAGVYPVYSMLDQNGQITYSIYQRKQNQEIVKELFHGFHDQDCGVLLDLPIHDKLPGSPKCSLNIL